MLDFFLFICLSSSHFVFFFFFLHCSTFKCHSLNILCTTTIKNESVTNIETPPRPIFNRLTQLYQVIRSYPNVDSASVCILYITYLGETDQDP